MDTRTTFFIGVITGAKMVNDYIYRDGNYYDNIKGPLIVGAGSFLYVILRTSFTAERNSHALLYTLGLFLGWALATLVHSLLPAKNYDHKPPLIARPKF
jgi:hypothetical protein